jgi:hypothetical protein
MPSISDMINDIFEKIIESGLKHNIELIPTDEHEIPLASKVTEPGELASKVTEPGELHNDDSAPSDSSSNTNDDPKPGKLILINGFRKPKFNPDEMCKILEEALHMARSGEYKNIILISDLTKTDSPGTEKTNIRWFGYSDHYSLIGKIYSLLSVIERTYGYKL